MKKLIMGFAFLVIAGMAYANMENITVNTVIDCNILELNSSQQVRLIGISCPKDDKLRQEASEYVRRTVTKGRAIRLEFDVQKKDQDGRLLAYVYYSVPMREWVMMKDGTNKHEVNTSIELFLNQQIIQQGFAKPLTIPPNVKYADLFTKLFKEARENKRGLWKKVDEGIRNNDAHYDWLWHYGKEL